MSSLVDTMSNRILIEASLRPLAGHRFQPTGFADLGAATYESPDGTRMLLVESAQSMANRLEKVCLASDGVSVSPDLAGLPYVHVRLAGDSQATTSSLVEAHRLNSPFVLAGKDDKKQPFAQTLVSKMEFRAEQGSPDWNKVALALMKYDPSSILHGLFMANLPKCKPKIEGGDRIRIPRAITGFIEASDVTEVNSGGVKNSRVDPPGTLRAEEVDGDVYSNVPYHRREFTAKAITAHFAIDVELVRSYRLPAPATGLLLALSLYKIRAFLDGGMRLRTACDLVLNDKDAVRVTIPQNETLPSTENLRTSVQAGIRECKKLKDLFADPAVTTLTAEVKRGEQKKNKRANEGDDEADADDDDEKK